MGVLVEELGAQLGLLRVAAIQADHVDGDVALLAHQLVDLVAVGGDHLLLAGTGGDGRAGLPALEAHADLGQGGGDVLVVGQHLVRQLRGGLVVDAQAAHGRFLVKSACLVE
ncbi:hypothetical protein D3C80_1599560 [compost metagenome]